MDEATADLIISWYKNLEDQLLDFINYVPFHERNINVFSPKLATIITESCGLLDSVIKYATLDSITLSDGTIINTEKHNLNISHYAELYGERLASFKAILLLSPVQFVRPFSNWDILDITYKNAPSLSWWKAHNDIKHDRINNLELANLNNAIKSLCGLFIAMVDNAQFFIQAMHRAKWLYYQHAVEVIYNWAIEGYPVGGIFAVIKTSLFALPLGRPMPEDVFCFRPASYPGSGHVLVPYFGFY